MPAGETTTVQVNAPLHYRAGVAQVDITPPPGLGLFGHGPESRIATGVAQRLRCQVFVLSGPGSASPAGAGGSDSSPAGAGGSDSSPNASADLPARPAGETVALVTCDLPAPSLLLQRRVVEKLHDIQSAQQAVPIGAHRLALMATHTHFGPAHYFGAGNFSGPFSARRTGLSNEVVDFLADRIAAGIKQAAGRMVKARIGWAYADVFGISKNRALPSLLRNRSLPDSLRGRLQAAGEQPEYAAIDPQLSLLRIDTWDANSTRYVPAGALSFFGVHPTVINNRNSLYTGDLFGFATREVARLAAVSDGGPGDSAQPVVFGIANGLQGDITSARSDSRFRESKRLGDRLGREIERLWREMPVDSMRESGPLIPAYQELWLPGAPLTADRGSAALCQQPTIGTASAGGAADHPTGMRIFAATRPGTRLNRALRAGIDGSTAAGCGAPKFPLITPQPAAQPGMTFPALVPIMLIRVGTGLIATAPGELTVTAGLRIAQAVEDVVAGGRTGPAKVTVAGLTNEYLLYIATAEEYEAQDYEGASTVYGPHSADYFRRQFACLASRVFAPNSKWAGCPPAWPRVPKGGPCSAPAPQGIDQSTKAPYSYSDTDLLPDLPDSHQLLGDPSDHASRCDADGYVVHSFRFAGPTAAVLAAPQPTGVGEDPKPRLRVGAVCGQTLVDTDEGANFRIDHDPAAARRPWRVRWSPGEAVTAACAGGQARIRVDMAGVHLMSEAFPIACGPAHTQVTR